MARLGCKRGMTEEVVLGPCPRCHLFLRGAVGGSSAMAVRPTIGTMTTARVVGRSSNRRGGRPGRVAYLLSAARVASTAASGT